MQKLQEKANKLIEERNQISIRFNEINGALNILNELAQEENHTEEANGTANIETYTIMHDRKGPSFGILFGRLTDNSRFIANAPNDPALLEDMTNKDYLGAKGKVSSAEGINVFTPD